MNKVSFAGSVFEIDILQKKDERSITETEVFTNLFV